MVFYSAFQQSYYWLPVIGLVIGLFATMVGSGGGFFFPVILILFYHIPAHVAVSTSLAATLPISGGVAPVLAGLMALRLPVKMVVGTSLMIVLINTL